MEGSPANSGNTQNLDSRTSDFHRPSKSPPSGIGGFGSQTMIRPEKCGTGLCEISENGIDEKRERTKATHQNFRNYFSYDLPHYEETGFWIPVSVPPMIESDCEEWADRGDFHFNGGYFPEGDMGWSQYIGEDSELTMWDVIVEMVHAARGKVNAIASGDLQRCGISWLSSHLLEQAWQEMAQTLNEANFCNVTEILEAEPPKWLPDSTASACMLCGVRFHPIMCSRHHCRFCGGIFCGHCSKGRSLLPVRFRLTDPQRVCDVCCVRLESAQPYLMDQVSNAAQLPTHDLTDLSTLRSWVNFPWGQTMEYEIYKAANTIQGYNKVGYLKPEKSIPDAILRRAKGLAIITVVKVGVMVTYNVGTGLVIARREDGSWSPPSAISTLGVGWGAQAGGELTDFIIVLRTTEAVKTFCGYAHLSLGAGVSAAVGITGRAFEADLRTGDGGYAACYTYSCSKAWLSFQQLIPLWKIAAIWYVIQIRFILPAVRISANSSSPFDMLCRFIGLVALRTTFGIHANHRSRRLRMLVLSPLVCVPLIFLADALSAFFVCPFWRRLFVFHSSLRSFGLGIVRRSVNDVVVA